MKIFKIIINSVNYYREKFAKVIQRAKDNNKSYATNENSLQDIQIDGNPDDLGWWGDNASQEFKKSQAKGDNWFISACKWVAGFFGGDFD